MRRFLATMVLASLLPLTACERDGVKCVDEMVTLKVTPKPYSPQLTDRYMYFGDKGMTRTDNLEDVPDHLLHAVWLETNEPRPPQLARIVDFTAEEKTVTIMTRQRGLLLQFSGTAGVWAADLAKANATLFAEQLPNSETAQASKERAATMEKVLGEVLSRQDDQAITIEDLERKRRKRTALWTKPTAKDYVRHAPVPLWYQTMKCQAPDKKGVWHRDIGKADELAEFEFIRKFAGAPATIPAAFDDSPH